MVTPFYFDWQLSATRSVLMKTAPLQEMRQQSEASHRQGARQSGALQEYWTGQLYNHVIVGSKENE